ncbi:hypothetical protein ABPG74_005625 [Tetrahymena malaccensis]
MNKILKKKIQNISQNPQQCIDQQILGLLEIGKIKNAIELYNQNIQAIKESNQIDQIFSKAQAVQSIEFLDCIKETTELTQQQYESYILKTILPLKGYDYSQKMAKQISNKQIQQEIIQKLKIHEQMVNGRKNHSSSKENSNQQKYMQQSQLSQLQQSQLAQSSQTISDKEQIQSEQSHLVQKVSRQNLMQQSQNKKNNQKYMKIATLCFLALFLIYIQKKFNISSKLVGVLKILLGLQ